MVWVDVVGVLPRNARQDREVFFTRQHFPIPIKLIYENSVKIMIGKKSDGIYLLILTLIFITIEGFLNQFRFPLR